MEPIKIALYCLAAICFLCAWLVPRQLRKRWEAKYKEKNKQSQGEDTRDYLTLGELPPDYLDKALDRAAARILVGIYQIAFIFSGIIIALISLIG